MPTLPIDALQNISNVAKVALNVDAVKNPQGGQLEPRAKATLWTQIAMLDEHIQELRQAAQVPPVPPADAPPPAAG